MAGCCRESRRGPRPGQGPGGRTRAGPGSAAPPVRSTRAGATSTTRTPPGRSTDPGTVPFSVLLGDRVVGPGPVRRGSSRRPTGTRASTCSSTTAVHGRGLGRDAVRTMAGLPGVRRAGPPPAGWIDPAADNVAAIRAYTSVGFRPVGVLRRYERDRDGRGWHDGLLRWTCWRTSRPGVADGVRDCSIFLETTSVS